MTVFVDAATIRAAHARAAARPLGAADERRWARVLDYAAGLTGDPSEWRAAELAGAGDGAPALCRRWLAEDLAAAAPLLEVFTGHHRAPEGGPPALDPALERGLGGWFAARGKQLLRMHVISGGFSRLMLDAEWVGGHGVVRIEQGGMFATEGRREVAVMRAVAARGYPVPEVLWEEADPAVVGHPFFVMAHVAGTARTDDAGIDDMLRAIAALHELDAVHDVADVDGLRGAPPEQVIRAQLDHWYGVYRSAVAVEIPLLERAFGWLYEHLCPTGPSAVVHGDPGPGNALQDELGVTAVIDWEFAHAGDPAEDWAYLALIRGRRLGRPDEWKERLRRTVGVDYDEPTWRAWEAYNQVKGACVNLTALEVFRTSPAPTPDLLAIGVAVHLRFLARATELVDGR